MHHLKTSHRFTDDRAVFREEKLERWKILDVAGRIFLENYVHFKEKHTCDIYGTVS